MKTEELRNTAKRLHELPAREAVTVAFLLDNAANYIEQLETEREMLRKVHWYARRLMRYHGVDNDETLQSFAHLKESVYLVNGYDCS